MVSITWPTLNEVDIVDKIRHAIGRDVTFYTVASSIACSACSLDPITNTSTDSFCVTCSGDYWIPVYSGTTLSGHITWGYAERLGWQTGGKQDEGECRVQVKYTVANEAVIDNCKWVVVDGREMQVMKKIPRGVQQLNRILVDLKELDSD